MDKLAYYTEQRIKTVKQIEKAEAKGDFKRVAELYYRVGIIDAYIINAKVQEVK